MYHIKAIIPTEDDIVLPQCMYYLKNPNNNLKIDDVEINISDQGSPNNTIVELEERQNQLLNKLDALYERIQTISTLCKLDVRQPNVSIKDELIFQPTEIVIVLNPNIEPSFIYLFTKMNPEINVTWHIHSSVPNEKSAKIKQFFGNNIETLDIRNKTNIKLIYKCISASAELRLTSLDLPLLGVVNTLRYLCSLYPNVILYDQNDYHVDSLLDQCHLLEKISGKNKEEIVKKLFSQYNNWIYKNDVSIVDLAAYIITNSQNISKVVPKIWYNKCKLMFS
ncbi:uncharacterized protein AIMP2 isoform X2 [Battus philenor]|uniref:uncharacterized protein AIMP2 isoform X2 n=1 Tax=Battus philenor TaxID=42288 RepID=UPI0035CFE636